MKTQSLLAAFLFALSVTSCGGGGGSTSATQTNGAGQASTPNNSVTSSIVRTNYGHPVFNFGDNRYNLRYHPDAWHLYEYTGDEIAPFSSSSESRFVAGVLKDEFNQFMFDLLNQANNIYIDIISGRPTSSDPIIQALDKEFALQVEQCVTQWSPVGFILEYADCNQRPRLAYRVPGGGVIVVSLGNHTPEEKRVRVGLLPLDRPSGWLGHGSRDFNMDWDNANGETILVGTFGRDRPASGVFVFSPSIDANGNPFNEFDLSQAEINVGAIVMQTAITNLRALRTGRF